MFRLQPCLPMPSEASLSITVWPMVQHREDTVYREGTPTALLCHQPQPPTEQLTKCNQREQFTCLQELARTELTNRALPIGITGAKFPGIATSAREQLESIRAAYVSSGIFNLYVQRNMVSTAT